MATEILRPVSNGDVIQFTPNVGTNWECVDDIVSDGITTYVQRFSGLAFNHLDLYSIDTPSGSGIISKIEVFALISAGYVNINPYRRVIIRIGGTIYESDSEQKPNNNFYTTSNIWILNPNTGVRWIWEDINRLQIGFKIIAETDGNHLGISCTQIYVEITYGLITEIRKNPFKIIYNL